MLAWKCSWPGLVSYAAYSRVRGFLPTCSFAPEYLKDLFRETNQVHDHDLRNSDLNLLPPKLLKKSFSYSGAVIWNSLPRHVRLANSLTEFKRSLKFSV